MTTHIKLDPSTVEESDVQFIPCSIEYDGVARVSAYFKEKLESNGIKTASFRGRPLLGSEVQLPEGYRGYVIRKAQGNIAESQVHDIEHSFKKITYWNLDRVPSKNDAIISALDWISLSNAIHEKVNPEDLGNCISTNGHPESSNTQHENTSSGCETNTTRDEATIEKDNED